MFKSETSDDPESIDHYNDMKMSPSLNADFDNVNNYAFNIFYSSPAKSVNPSS